MRGSTGLNALTGRSRGSPRSQYGQPGPSEGSSYTDSRSGRRGPLTREQIGNAPVHPDGQPWTVYEVTTRDGKIAKIQAPTEDMARRHAAGRTYAEIYGRDP